MRVPLEENRFRRRGGREDERKFLSIFFVKLVITNCFLDTHLVYCEKVSLSKYERR